MGMSETNSGRILEGSKVLVCGIANEHSIAYGCAKAFRELGADLAITYLNEKSRNFVVPLDVSQPGELEAVFAAIEQEWGKLDVLVHSIAWATKEDLQGGLLDCSAVGFGQAMDISCHSFVR